MTAAQQIEEKFASDEFTYKTAREIARLLGVTQKSEREAVNRVLRSVSYTHLTLPTTERV